MIAASEGWAIEVRLAPEYVYTCAVGGRLTLAIATVLANVPVVLLITRMVTALSLDLCAA